MTGRGPDHALCACEDCQEGPSRVLTVRTCREVRGKKRGRGPDRRKRRAHERPGRWYPGATRPGTRTVSVGLPVEAIAAVDEQARLDGVARNSWLRGAVMQELVRRGAWPPRGEG